MKLLDQWQSLELSKKKRIWLIGIGITLVIMVLITSGIFLLAGKHSTPPPVKSVPKQTKKAAEPTKPLDPLSIAAIRARTYPASTITTEQNLGDQGGYSNAIISYTSDGFKVYGLQSTPNGTAPPGGWPVIIFNHGYIDPAQYQTNGSEYQQFISTLARAGYMVIKPDYRGHGRSEGEPGGGHFSPVYAYDELNLISSLKQYAGVNPGRIGVFGHSLGGHVALRTIVVSKDVKATSILAGVVGSMNDIFYNWPHSPMPNDRPKVLVTGKKQALVSKYGEPNANPDFWNSVSAINYVDAVAGTVQIQHDENDSTVPELFSDHLVQALQKASKPVEYYTYPGDDHQLAQSRSLVLQRLVDFYRAHL